MTVKAIQNITPLVIVIVLLSSVMTFMSPHFLTILNLTQVLTATATLGILAVGASFVIGAGEIDLSVGGVMAASAAASLVLVAYLSVSPLWGPIFCLLIGGLFGVLSGGFVAYAKIPSFIVSLGMLSIARGLALLVSDGRPIYGLPEHVLALGQSELIGIPIPVIILGFVVIWALWQMSCTVFGHHTLALGDSEQAAERSGVRTKILKVKLFALSGVLAGLAGLIFMARVNAADPNAGMGYELTAITAAIIGGTSLFGGRASIAGAVLGAFLISLIQNSLTLMAMPAYYQQLVIGTLLILSVSLNWQRRGK